MGIYVDKVHGMERTSTWPFAKGANMFCDPSEEEKMDRLAVMVKPREGKTRIVGLTMPSYKVTGTQRKKLISDGVVEEADGARANEVEQLWRLRASAQGAQRIATESALNNAAGTLGKLRLDILKKAGLTPAQADTMDDMSLAEKIQEAGGPKLLQLARRMQVV